MNNLFLQFCNKNANENENTKNTILALKIKEYLKDNINEDILLEDISNDMNLSIVHILRIFKKEFGLPIHSYILNKKVHLARKLISQNIPISQVAQTAGFFDQSHLNKSFKRVFQLTPKEYQKNIFL
ncbi:AraC family transcriptional regulator [Poseidonibacter lekithochrous]|uniref:helix-turn-helix domain-containing protein n=1 Tax=Poseidonibacter TaxID=2321187 RepID=UPI001C083AA8|nr:MULTISPECIES: AraC family transcriptional regulator [Poseidonibacter]MBU3015114.1 AraC family transcriptional regulator [Poseidonibacter lekithochrous]MDO6828411.1 AraC family transcriptional regulator [Poseidonibacter sp. 1_MG-2023]